MPTSLSRYDARDFLAIHAETPLLRRGLSVGRGFITSFSDDVDDTVSKKGFQIDDSPMAPTLGPATNQIYAKFGNERLSINLETSLRYRHRQQEFAAL